MSVVRGSRLGASSLCWPEISGRFHLSLCHWSGRSKTAGQDRQEVNLGLCLFQQIRIVFRLCRIHRHAGQSVCTKNHCYDCAMLSRCCANQRRCGTAFGKRMTSPTSPRQQSRIWSFSFWDQKTTWVENSKKSHSTQPSQPIFGW